ncbi:acyl-[acyl-carrier-protein]--UDP-N-acetylglucosamine O-acyltransferase [Candidatus Poribacteria bacterium]|nr:MAG: acyl-[acyl-carrier-protein]--UDP-N-acetylglucosamine O-acyltransferase [Candidatus Poribacteria bacterium]
MLETNIHPTAIISPKATLEEGVKIGPYSLISEDVYIGRGTVIGPHVQIEKWTTIGEECKIFFGATIGNESKDLKYGGWRSYVKIGNRNILREYVSISRSTFEEGATTVGDNNLLMNWVNIAHDSIVGNRTIMANFVSLAGHVVIEDDVRLGAHAALHQYVRVGKMAMAGGFSKIVQDIPPFMLSAGQPARVRSLNRIGIRTSRINPLSQLTSETLAELKKAFRILFRSGLPLKHAVARVKEELEATPEVEYLLEFIEASKRGIGFSQPNRTLNG